MPSENSLRDELNPMCRCGHPLTNHGRNPERALCIGNRNLCRCAAFIPADAETAGEPEAPEDLPLCRSCGKRVETWFDRSVCAEPCESMHDRCSACGVTVTPCPNMSEPEAPEHACKPGATLYYCPTAGELESDCHGGFDVCCSNPEQHVQVSPAPPRPPFLVAYATGSGALMELALPGEAFVAVVDGSLVISHASGVLGIQHVRPLEGP